VEREIPLFGRQIMPYQIGTYVLTALLCFPILYADNCDEGSEKDTKKTFHGIGGQRTGKLLGWRGIRYVNRKIKVD